jgi:hypothetical protein
MELLELQIQVEAEADFLLVDQLLPPEAPAS